MTPDERANKILNEWLAKTDESPEIGRDLFFPIVAAIESAIAATWEEAAQYVDDLERGNPDCGAKELAAIFHARAKVGG